MTIAITGATGFVGQHLVRSLHARGTPVRALVRVPDASLPGDVEQVVVPGFDDTGRLAAALRGVQGVVHLAGRAHVIRDGSADPLTEFRRVNADGTEILARAAAAGGARRFVFVSSIAAAGVNGGTIREGTASRPVTPYGISKLEGEQRLFRAASDLGLESIALRPPAILGPGMKGNPLRMLRLVHRRIPLPFGAMRAPRSFIFIGNLIAAIETAVHGHYPGPRAYIVADGTAISTRDLALAMGEALGTPARLFSVPAAALKGIGWVGDAIGRIGAFPVSTYEIDRLTAPLVIDGSSFMSDTGYMPEVTFAQGMREMADWFLNSRLSEGKPHQ